MPLLSPRKDARRLTLLGHHGAHTLLAAGVHLPGELLGMAESVVMHLLWFHALGLREPSRVAIGANDWPILTALAGRCFLGQTVTPIFGLGAVLVITGVVASQQ